MLLKNQGQKKLVSANTYPYALATKLKLFLLLSGWCKLLCIEDNKSYLCPVNKLESDDGLGLRSSDIVAGKIVIWKYRGTPYEAEILSVHSKDTLHVCNAMTNVFNYVFSCGNKKMHACH